MILINKKKLLLAEKQRKKFLWPPPPLNLPKLSRGSLANSNLSIRKWQGKWWQANYLCAENKPCDR